MRKPPGEDLVCWMCDYGLIGLAIILVLGVSFLIKSSPTPLVPPPLAQLPTSVEPLSQANPLPTLPPAPSSTPKTVATARADWTQSAVTRTPQPTFTATLQRELEPTTGIPAPSLTPTQAVPPEFVLVFVPVNWKGSRQEFEDTARKEADYFIQASQIGQFFAVRTVFLENGLTNADLTSNDVLHQMTEFGLHAEPADRYIGITDGDIAPDGSNWVAGFTHGPDSQGVLSEAGYETITAHELGHTFGLCDEYNYRFWKEQDDSYLEGCPNPYPDTCPRDTGQVEECRGALTSDENFSIMAASGPADQYGYNDACLDHLKTVFQTLAGQKTK